MGERNQHLEHEMNYLNKIQRTIKLPSGYDCIVRRQTQLEAIEIGSPPGFFLRNERLRARNQPELEETPAERDEWLKFIARQNRIILTRCVVGPLKCGTEEISISGEQPSTTGLNEISWALLTDQDVEAIISTSNELSGFTKTDKEAVATFPEASAHDERDRHVG
jgi:hypothetical protein